MEHPKSLFTGYCSISRICRDHVGAYHHRHHVGDCVGHANTGAKADAIRLQHVDQHISEHEQFARMIELLEG